MGIGGNAVDALLVTVENYAHILFWVVALDAAGSLGWPIYRAFSVGLLSCSVTGLVWSVFLEHRMAAAESAVFIVFYLIIIACRVDIAAQNKTAIVIYHSFCFIAVFCRYRVSALEGIPYSYVISFHDSFHLIVDTRFIARKDYRIFNIALKACGSSL